MESFRFTLATIRALPVPSRRTRYRDTGQEGLIVAVSPGGSRVYYVFKRSRNRLHEERVGLIDSMSVDEARAKAREILAGLDKGQDVSQLANRKRSGDTFGELWAWWAKAYGEPRRSRWRATQATYENHLAGPLGLRPMSLLTRADVRELHRSIGAAGTERTANLVLGLVRTVINKAIAEGRWTGVNPAAGLEGFKRPARGRVLSAEEGARFLAAAKASGPTLRDLVLLLLYTGQRRGNVMAMRWDELDLTAGVWTIPRTKAGRTHAVALLPHEVAILEARRAGPAGETEWVFPARTGAAQGHITRPANGWTALLKRAGIKDFTVHDLRRTHGSWMLSAGVAIDVISKTLDHSSVRVTEEVYAHLDVAAKRAAKQQAFGR